jgi:hypothetical protein
MYCVITFRFVLLVWLHDFSLSVFLHYRKKSFSKLPLECQDIWKRKRGHIRVPRKISQKQVYEINQTEERDLC